ncbi:MAG: alpha/beta fold hydrolase [Alphaproteobacteria bacterium]
MRAGLIAVMAWAVLVFSDTAAQARMGSHLAALPCWFDLQEGWRTRCYHFTVPENWDQPDDRPVTMPVVVLIPGPGSGNPTPVLHLMGGPGQPAGITTDRELAYWGHLLAQREWSRNRRHILMDPRGVGKRASPELRCSPLSDVRRSLEIERLGKGTRAWRQAVERLITGCRNRFLQRGIDLSAYTTKNTARDILALRSALNVRRWDLYGVSYGTRLALDLLALDSTGVRAAILDGLDPPHLPTLAEFLYSVDRSIRLLAADCAADSACNAQHPELDKAVERIVNRLRESPVVLDLRPRDGRRLELLVTDEIFLEALEYALSYTDWLRFIPALITLFDKGQTSLFSHLATTIIDDPYYFTDANALALSVRCSAEVPENSAEAFEHTRNALPLLRNLDIELGARLQCSTWFPDGVRARPLPDPVSTGVPVLMLSGAYDTRTPPTFGLSQLQTLPNGYHLIIRNQSHGVSGTSSCAQEAMATFLDDPERFALPACAEHQTPPDFVTGFGAPIRNEPLNAQ